MTDIDRQKYIAELGKLLSGMARADREAVLRGVAARFDEAGDDNAVIAELGSPTFAAVSVLRGYTPPEEPEEEEYAGEEFDFSPAPAQAAPEPEAVEAGHEEAAPGGAQAVETAPEEEPEAGPDAAAAEPAEIPAPEAVEAVQETEAAEEEAAPEEADVDAGGLDIEVYSDNAGPQPEAEVAAPEEDIPERPVPEETETEGPEPAGIEPVVIDLEEIEPEEDAPEAPAREIYIPEPEPERAPLKGGRVFLCALLALVPGVPVAAALIVFALAVLAAGAALAYAGGVAISFAFLGMSVAADIMLCVGFGLAVAAVGLVLVFLALWFFLRCVIGLYSRVFAAMGGWCRGEVRK